MTAYDLVGTEIPVGNYTLRATGVGSGGRCIVQLDKPGCTPRTASRGEMDQLREARQENTTTQTH